MLMRHERAKEKKESSFYYTHSPLPLTLQGWSLRQCHCMWQSFLRKRIDNAAAELRGDATSSVELLVSQGLVTRKCRGKRMHTV